MNCAPLNCQISFRISELIKILVHAVYNCSVSYAHNLAAFNFYFKNSVAHGFFVGVIITTDDNITSAIVNYCATCCIVVIIFNIPAINLCRIQVTDNFPPEIFSARSVHIQHVTLPFSVLEILNEPFALQDIHAKQTANAVRKTTAFFIDKPPSIFSFLQTRIISSISRMQAQMDYRFRHCRCGRNCGCHGHYCAGGHG